MALLELNLDAFLAARQDLNLASLNLPGVVTISQLSGVDGLTLSFDGRAKAFSEHDLELLVNACGDTRFNLRISPRADLLQLALDLPLRQITFVGEDIFKTYGADLDKFIPQLKDTGKLISFLLEPELAKLKKAYRLNADYIELDARAFTAAPTPHVQAEAQEQLALLARTAEKNGMGVAVSGGIGFHSVQPLVTIDAVENVVAGRAILARAIFVGLETAIRDFKGNML